MRSFITAAIVLIFSINIFGQELIPDKQFMLGCTNVGSNEQVTHYINAFGEVWQWNGSSFVTGGVYSSSLVTTGNADFNSNDWPGFNFNWLYGGPYWSLGLYKVSNSKQTDKYFYLDARDSDFGSGAYNPDFHIYFDNSEGVYKKWRPDTQSVFSNGSVIRIWDIFSVSPNTSGLQNFWSNALVMLTDGSNPRIVWGKHPTMQSVSSYKIYRGVSSDGTNPPPLNQFSLIHTTENANIFIYTDEAVSIGSGYKFFYYVKAYNGSLSDPTNLVSTNGYFLEKKKLDEAKIERFTLGQNYPNPFNPITTISFTLIDNSFVTLNIYNVLGNEIATLVNEMKDRGNHNITFDASRLSSGVYYYEIIVDKSRTTKKMLLAK